MTNQGIKKTSEIPSPKLCQLELCISVLWSTISIFKELSMGLLERRYLNFYLLWHFLFKLLFIIAEMSSLQS